MKKPTLRDLYSKEELEVIMDSYLQISTHISFVFDFDKPVIKLTWEQLTELGLILSEIEQKRRSIILDPLASCTTIEILSRRAVERNLDLF